MKGFRLSEDQLAAIQARMNKALSPAVEKVTAEGAKQKRTKYNNVRTVRDGIKFDSRGEADRWTALRMMERGGLISKLRHHVRYALVVRNIHICDYEADFVYIDGRVEVVEDWKSPPTRERRDYQIKKRLMSATLGIEIKEMGS